MITKNMILAGMKQGIVNVGTCGERKVSDPAPDDTVDKLACSIGNDTFHFGNSKDGTIQNYLEANSDDTIAGSILETLEGIRDNLDCNEYRCCEDCLLLDLKDKSVLPKRRLVAIASEARLSLQKQVKEIYAWDSLTNSADEAGSGIKELGLSPTGKFLFIPHGKDNAIWNEDGARVFDSFGKSLAKIFPKGFRVEFVEGDLCLRYRATNFLYNDYFDGVIIPQSWVRDAMASSEFSRIISKLAEQDSEIGGFVEEARESV